MTDEEEYKKYLQEQAEREEYQQYLNEMQAQEIEQEALNTPLEKSTIVNKMPSELALSRAVVKNLAGSPEAAFNYLQKQHKDFEFRKDDDDEIVARRRGENAWWRLDPKGFDAWDLTDIGYDVPAGLAQGAATAFGGLTGGAAGLPAAGVGAIPGALLGASAASAASGAGLETLRQALGSVAGLEDNIKGSNIALSGALGAVTPFVFGSGAGAKEVAKYATKKGLSEIEKATLEKMQRGGIGRTYDFLTKTVGPEVGELISGIKKPIIQTAQEILPSIKRADVDPLERVLPLRQTAKSVSNELRKATSKVGKELEDLIGMIDSAPQTTPGIVKHGTGIGAGKGTIPKDAVLEPFYSLVKDLEKGFTPTGGQIEDMAALQKIIQKEVGELPDMLTAAQLDGLRKRFKELAGKYGLNYAKSGQAVGTLEGASAIDSQVAIAFESSRRKITDLLTEKLAELSPENAGKYEELTNAYSTLKELARDSNNDLKSAKTLSRFLGKSIADDIEAQKLLDLEDVTGINLTELAKKNMALKIFSKPSSDILSLYGTTSTSRTIPLATAGGLAGAYTGAQIGQKAGGTTYLPTMIGGALGGLVGAKMGSPAAIRKYMEMASEVRGVPEKMGSKYLPYLMMNVSRTREK